MSSLCSVLAGGCRNVIIRILVLFVKCFLIKSKTKAEDGGKVCHSEGHVLRLILSLDLFTFILQSVCHGLKRKFVLDVSK
jgi:hypothetical protein